MKNKDNFAFIALLIALSISLIMLVYSLGYQHGSTKVVQAVYQALSKTYVVNESYPTLDLYQATTSGGLTIYGKEKSN